MNIFVDIDGTICTQKEDYSNAQPYQDRIDRYNRLYDQGHNVVYWTARGSGTGLSWEEITRRQLSQWGVKYHELRFGKPPYDLLVDDRAVNPCIPPVALPVVGESNTWFCSKCAISEKTPGIALIPRGWWVVADESASWAFCPRCTKAGSAPIDMIQNATGTASVR